MFKQTPKQRVLFVRRFIPVAVAVFGVFSMAAANLGSAPPAYAATSSTINFQARLKSNTGAIVPDGSYNITFKIYDAASSSGSSDTSCSGDSHCLWVESRTGGNKVSVANGYLSVQLGSVNGFGSIDWSKELWLTMNIGDTGSPDWDGEMDPRLPLTATPYSFAAGQLRTTSGSNASTLSIQAPTGGSQTFVIQDQGGAGTYNILTAPSGSDGYIKLQGSTPGTQQTGSFNVSGTGIAAVFQAPSFDAATASSTLTIGGTNAATLNVAANAAAHTINIGTGAAAQTISIGSGDSTSTLDLSAGTGGIDFNISGSEVGTFDQNGTLQIGRQSGLDGKIQLNNATNNHTVTLQTGTTSADYTIKLPSAIGTEGQCVVVEDVTGSVATLGYDTCGTGGGGSLQDAYDQSGTDDPQIQLDGTNGGLKVRDASSTVGNILQIQNSAGNTTYLAVTNAGISVTGDVQASGSVLAPTFDRASSGALTIGNTNATSINIGKTGSNIATTINGTAVVKPTTGNDSATAFQVQKANSTAVLNVDTSTSLVTVSNLTSSNGLTITTGTFTNGGSTVNSTLALTDFAGGGSIGSAASTVDIYTSISVAQTTGSQTLTIPTPTASTTYGRVLYLSNIGTANFTLLGTPLKPGATATLVWSNTNGGASWQYSGADGASILNQSSATQTADFKISGTGVAGTLQASTFDTSSAGALNFGSSNATSLSFGSNAVTTISLGASTTTNTINIGNGALSSGTQTINIGTGATSSGADNVTIGSTNDGSTTTIQGGTGNVNLITNSSSASIIAKSSTNSATAFQIQNASSVALFSVDTSTKKVFIGPSGGDSAGTIFILGIRTSDSSDPTGTAGAMYYNSTSGKFRCYQGSAWTDCIGNGGGGSSSKTITLVPEYEGAVLTADGSSNSGTLTSDYVDGLSSGNGYKHNYYEWTTSQATSQDYDIIINKQLPSDFSASTEFDAGSWKVWTYVDNTTDAAITMTVYDNDGTACANGVSIKGASTGWQQITLTDFDTNSNCDFTANSIMTIRIHMSSKSPSSNKVRVGEIQYSYTN